MAGEKEGGGAPAHSRGLGSLSGLTGASIGLYRVKLFF